MKANSMTLIRDPTKILSCARLLSSTPIENATSYENIFQNKIFLRLNKQIFIDKSLIIWYYYLNR